MYEIECLSVRRIAVKMKQGQRDGHGASIGQSQRRRRCRRNADAGFTQQYLKGSPRFPRAAETWRQLFAISGLLASVLTTLAALSALSALLASLAGLVLATLLLLTGFLLPAAALLSAATLLRVALALLLVALRIVLAWIVRHWDVLQSF